MPVERDRNLRLVAARPSAGPVSAEAFINASWLPLFVEDYGAVGDGVTDDTAAIQAAEDDRAAWQTLRFTPGKTYIVDTVIVPRTRLLTVRNPGVWDATGATLQYGSASNLASGTDGGALAVINVLTSDFTFYGTVTPLSVNAVNASRFAFALQSTKTGFQIFGTINNTNAAQEAIGVWACIAYNVSIDITGIAIVGRHTMTSGILKRPQCPIMDNTGAIITHADIAAVLVGGVVVNANTTGFAIVSMQTEGDIVAITNGALAVPSIISNAGAAVTNTNFMDLVCFDIGTRRQERYGAVLDLPQRQSFGVGGVYTPGWLVNDGSGDSNVHIITLTANVAVTIANPTNTGGLTVDRTGELVFIVQNKSGGALATPVAFTGAKFRVSAIVNPGNNQQITVRVMWDKVSDTYIETSRSVAVAT